MYKIPQLILMEFMNAIFATKHQFAIIENECLGNLSQKLGLSIPSLEMGVDGSSALMLLYWEKGTQMFVKNH